MAKVLVIEDDPFSTKLLLGILGRGGYEVASATGGEQGFETAKREPFQVVVTDWRTSDPDGFDVIRMLHVFKPQLPVILLTSFPRPEISVQAERLGAYACVAKWPDPGNFLGLLQRAIHWPLQGRSRAMQQICKHIGIVAATEATVLICGEHGTGRTSVSRLIHRHSQRADQPFVSVECDRALDQQHTDSLETQGRHFDQKFQEALHGTLFLQHIGNLTHIEQAQLLKFLQHHAPAYVRVIASIEPGGESRLRDDLYHRLTEFVIRIPPLREHPEDISELVKDFMDRYAEASKISEPAIHYLQQQDWPGNVREVRTILDEALLLSQDSALTPELFEGLLLR
jgi:DNA-binding NtrC family response regulator